MIYLANLSRFSDKKGKAGDKQQKKSRMQQRNRAQTFYFPVKRLYHFPPRLQRHCVVFNPCFLPHYTHNKGGKGQGCERIFRVDIVAI